MHLLVLALWSLVLMVVAVVAGAALGISGTPSVTQSHGHAVVFLLWNVAVQLLTFALPVVLVTWMYYRDNQRDFYRLDFGRRRWMLALAGVAVLLFLVPLTDWLTTWNDSWPLPEGLRKVGEESQQTVEALMKECHPLLGLFGLALIPALCEELFFRAGVQNLLRRWFKNPHAAVWVAAAIFSLAHFELSAFLPRFFLGALLGYLYLYGRSLLVNVTAHFVNNAIIVLAYAIAADGNSGFDPSAPLAVPPLLTVACILVAAALFYGVFLRHKSSLRQNDNRLKISR